jgi:hypothetical protein
MHFLEQSLFRQLHKLFQKMPPLPPFRRKRGLITLQNGNEFYNFLSIKKEKIFP